VFHKHQFSVKKESLARLYCTSKALMITALGGCLFVRGPHFAGVGAAFAVGSAADFTAL